MNFQEQVAADLAGVIHAGEASVEIVYTPKGGEAKTINAIALSEEIIIDSDDQGETRIHHQDFVILTDITKGIATPLRDDLVTYGGLDRCVVSVDGRIFGKTRLSTTAPETISKHHKMHKKKAT